MKHVLRMMDFALKLMDFALKLMDFALKLMNFALKLMNFAFKMMNFADGADIFSVPEPVTAGEGRIQEFQKRLGLQGQFSTEES